MNKILLLILSFSIIACENEIDSTDTPLYSVERGEIQNKIQFVGRVRAENSVLIRSPFDSNLVSLDVSLGQKISLNQNIAVISKPEDNARISELIQKKGLLDQLEYRREQLKLKITNNQKELKRLSRLLASGSISASERENIRVENALEKKEYKIVESQIVTTRDEIKYLKRRELNSSKTLKSPISGTVTELWTEESNITPGMNVDKDTTMAVIEKSGLYILKGTVSEPDYIKMELGQEVDVKLAYVDNAHWTGKVKSLAPTAGAQSLGIGRFAVNVVFKANAEQIKTGLEGIGTISLDKRKNVLRVPRSALLQEGQNFFVSYPSEKGPQKFPVKVGLVGDLYAEIVGELSEGSKIFQYYVSSR